MAKKKDNPFRVAKADLKNYTRSEQRKFMDLGMVEGEKPEAAPKAAAAK